METNKNDQVDWAEINEDIDDLNKEWRGIAIASFFLGCAICSLVTAIILKLTGKIE